MKRREGPQLTFDFGGAPAPPSAPVEAQEPPRKPRPRQKKVPREGTLFGDAAPAPEVAPPDPEASSPPVAPVRSASPPEPVAARDRSEISASEGPTSAPAPRSGPNLESPARHEALPPRSDESPLGAADLVRDEALEALADAVPFELLDATPTSEPPHEDPEIEALLDAVPIELLAPLPSPLDELLDVEPAPPSARTDAPLAPSSDRRLPGAEASPLDRAAVVAPALADIVFVVPTGRHVERFALAGYEATTFPALCEQLLARLTELSVATRAEERAFLAAVVAEGGAPAEIGALAVDSSAFFDAFLDALDDVARTVGSFARARGTAPEVAARRTAALASLEARLDRALSEHGLVAKRRVAEVLASRVPLSASAVVEEALGARSIETRLWLDFGPSELALVRALELSLSPRGGRATVCLPMHERPFDSERLPDALERLSTWALVHLEDAPRTVPLEPRLGTLDDAPAPGAAPLAGVEIRVAASVEAEAHAVVDAVARALAGGARVEAIAVGVHRLDDTLSDSLTKAFDDAGIVVHGLSPRRSLLPAFVAEALSALDKTDARTFSRLISSGYVDLGFHSREARQVLSALVRKLEGQPNVVASTARAATEVAVARAARPHARSEERERELVVVDRVFRAFESFPREGTTRALAEATLAWLVALGVPSRATRAEHALFASDDLDDVSALEAAALARDARAWEELETALAELVSAAERAGRGEAATSRARFFEELFAVYRPDGTAPGAARSFAIRVAKLSELADDDLDLLVVPSATNAGLGPAPLRSALVSKETLVALGYDPLVAAAKGLAALSLASLRAAEVVLTACEGEDDDGSPIAKAVLALVDRGATLRTFGRGSRLDAPLSVADATVVRRLAGELPAQPAARARIAIEREREGFFLSERRPMSAVVGEIHDDRARGVLAEESGRGKPLALTGLERLAECAFRGYAHVLLGAREPVEDADIPTARDEGTRLHGALHVALGAVRERLRERPRDVDAIVAAADDAVVAYLADVETNGPLEPILDRRVRAVAREVVRDAASDPRWTFEVGEQAFGEPFASSWPPLVLGEGAAEVRLRGRIDRVDVGALSASARVVDYKRGRLDELARKLGTTALQVPLYALAAKEPLAVEEVKGIYYSLRDDELRRPNEKARGEETIDGLLADGTVGRVALAVVQRLREGDVAPRPPNETLCRTCGLAGGCRRPRFAMPAEEDEAGGGRP